MSIIDQNAQSTTMYHVFAPASLTLDVFLILGVHKVFVAVFMNIRRKLTESDRMKRGGAAVERLATPRRLHCHTLR